MALSVSALRLRVFAVPPRHRRLARGVVNKGGDRAGQVGVGHHLGKDLQHVDERPSGLELLKEPRGNHAVVIEVGPAQPEHEPAGVIGNAVSANHESSLLRARPPNCFRDKYRTWSLRSLDGFSWLPGDISST